jgi:hypothetical protein
VPQSTAWRVKLDQGGAFECEQFGDPAKQRSRVPADADVAVRQQDMTPASFARKAVENVAM